MLTILLCDDNQRAIDKYNMMITRVAEKHKIGVALSVFLSAESLIFHLSDDPNQADIIYLDILMGGQNGLDAAKQLRGYGCKAEIIFLTVSEDYVFDAFDVMPVQYLIKEKTTASKFEQIFLRAVSLTKDKTAEMFVYESNTIRKLIPLKDISHFEIWKRVVTVHCSDGETFKYYTTMERLEKSLQKKNFIRAHRSYMVNMQYIAQFNAQNLLLKTGHEIPIGGTYRRQAEEAFAVYMSRFRIYRA
ncbi:MAG: LytTR family DNA-binding domain-containing protein [Oscillospiraceae bacterium]|jgi:DNA-binding LytR/AlgR family response regulator|nr:LytTR family DNA-binding domain-containing protein [Oscillospiraceae bacterium]